MIKTYETTPANVEAIQFSEENKAEVLAFLGWGYTTTENSEGESIIVINTSLRSIAVEIGDYIVKDANGDFSVKEEVEFGDIYTEVIK